jgi:hypothetical protein
MTKAKVIILSTKKADLKISGVTFKVPEDTSFKPVTVKTTFSGGDSTRADGYKIYKLGIFAPAVTKTTNGEFIIKTNHPDKAEISIRGTITK